MEDETPKQSYTPEEVEALLDEHDRDWQGKLTRTQQAAADTRRERERVEGELRAELDGLKEGLKEVRAQSTQRDPDIDTVPEDWKDIESGPDLYRKISRLVEKKASRQPDNGPELNEVHEALARIEDMELARDTDRLRSTYKGMTEEQLRQVYETARRNGVGDLDWIAHRLFGPPEKFLGGEANTPSEDEVRKRNRSAVLSGRAKAQSSGPPVVKVRRGLNAYADVQKVGEKWAEDNGIT